MGSCNLSTASDAVLLTFQPMPIANAGNDAAICSGATYQPQGFAQNALSIDWVSMGDGTFSAPGIANPIYTPGSADKTAGSVMLVYKAFGMSPCNLEVATDTMVLTIRPLPSASIGGSAIICEGSPALLSVNLTGTPPWSITYSSGTQNFVISNILSSPYTFNVSPTITTAYTLQAVSDQYCNGVSFGGIALITVNPLPLPFLLSATGNGQYCQGSAGVELVLGGSQLGVVYQLMYGPQALGVPRAGTGNAISFGYVSNPGIYHVVASNPLTNCSLQMPGNVNVSILPLPIVDFVADTACLSSPTTFTLTGASVQDLVSCAWLFGDGGSATYAGPANAVHTYPAYGNYNASVTVTDVNGCQRTIGHPVSVYPSPVSFFAWDEPVCDGSPVDFVNLSYTSLPDYIAQWTWYFGDGSSSFTIPWPGNPNISHTFPTSGLFPVSLKVVSEFGCADSTMRMLNVLPQPVVDFSYAVACEAMAVQFQDLTQVGAGGEATEWYWDFGDPTTGAANQAFVQHPAHTFSSYGSFVVTLHVITSNGCENQVSKTVLVNPGPLANFVSDTVCAGASTQFTDLSQGGNGSQVVQWDWDFGDGSAHSNQQNPVHLFAAPGLYVVKLVVTDANGCQADTSLQVRVWELPYASFTSSAQNCAGSPVQFTSQSASSQGLLVLYEWSFGDGGTATVASPASPNVQHTYTLPGQYLVTLVVTNSNNCQSTATGLVTIGANPVANFTFPAVGTCEGTAVQFTDASVPNGAGSITTWLWSFGDPLSGGNNASSQQNPLHVFGNAGAYDVVLTIHSINGCQGTITKQVMISAKPQASFTADTACLGEPTTFVNLSTANGGSLNTYDWDFGDGSPHSNNAAPQHLYAAAGTYNVKLTVGNTNGCSHDTTIAIMVAQLPLAVFTYPNQACAQTLVSFDDLSTSPQGYIVQWQWSFGDGATAVVDFPNPSDVQHAYASAGTYNVVLTVVTSLGCEDAVSHTVVITSPPIANFNTGPTSCAGMPVQFNDATQTNGGGPLVTWAWNFGDPSSGTSNTSGMQNPIHVFDTAGTYGVTLIVSNTGGCNDTIVKQVMVGEAPLASFAADTVCLGQPTHFADSSIANATSIASWQWMFGDGSTSTQQNPQHTYGNWGAYNVTLQVTNSAGCMSDTTIEVLVRPLPVALFMAEGQCAGAPTQFTDLSSTALGSIGAWQWDFGDGGTDTVQHPTHTYLSGGTYTVTLVVSNNFGCSQTLVQSIAVFNSPTANYSAYPVFCPAGQVTFQDLSSGNGSPITQRMWYFGDGFYSSSANPVYTYSHPDSCYLVTLITSNAYGCADTLADTVCSKPAFAFTFGYDAGCAGLATSFSPQNLAQGDTLMFVQWNFGDPASGPYNQSNKYHPTHVYTTPGTYFVKLRAWNSDNCVDSTYREVVVRQVPVAEFTWPIAPACDSVVNFTNATNVFGALIDSVYWNFGDGSDTLVQSPLPPFMQHKFPQYGMYDVLMKAYVDNGCSAEVQHAVKVKCLSSYFAVSDTVCQGSAVAFADSSAPAAAITSWLWLFGDDQYSQYFSFNPQVIHVYDSAGLFHASLTTTAIVNGLSVQDVYEKWIYVRPAPKASIGWDAACQGQEVQFRDFSTQFADSIVAWKWYFGDGKTSLLREPQHLYTGDTLFDVVLQVHTLAGCNAADTLSIELAPVPQLMLSPSSGLYCDGGLVALSDTSGVAFENYRWIWGDGDTLSGIEALASHGYELGSFWARLEATSAYGCISVDSAWVEVKPGPVAAFAIDKPKVPVTNPVVYFSDKTSSPISPMVAWNWYVNDTVFAGNGQSILYSFADTARYAYVPDTGAYKVTLWAQNAAGCSDTVSRYVRLYADEAFFNPTAFSPNGDGKNDYFIPLVKYYKPEGFLFQVYNRWGMLVFESYSPSEPWDGYFKGSPSPVGAYTWLVEAVDLDNKRVTKQGSVVLIR
jgi:gliding motility-associated-like protein